MVRKFRDRVRYYEIMNEWYGLVGTPEEYIALLREATAVIREEYPDAKIGIAWHGLGSAEEVVAGDVSAERDGLNRTAGADGAPTFRPHSDLGKNEIESGIRSFADKFADLKTVCERHGFHGEYLMSEFAFSASYPPVSAPRWT